MPTLGEAKAALTVWSYKVKKRYEKFTEMQRHNGYNYRGDSSSPSTPNLSRKQEKKEQIAAQSLAENMCEGLLDMEL